MATETSPITLDEINAAIRAIFTTGLSYSIAGRTFTHAALADLQLLRKQVIRDEARGGSSSGASDVSWIGSSGSTEADEWGD